ncbi:MAG: hypothetical protein ABIP79_00370 [Chitinophagaceae bacterium]
MKKLFPKCLITLAVLLFIASAEAQIGSRQTTFKPEVHGLKFVNSLEVEVMNDIKMSGFCGGMVYTALDYFKAKKPVPMQNFKPANGTPLFDYMWGRQRSSVVDNIDKWTELFVNPFGWRTDEFFNWGLQGSGGGRLQELKTEIDKGSPVPLGFFKSGEGGAGPHHQVLAIGYKGGRYKGDLGAYKEDLEISVYDPNFPGVTKILKANPAKHIYYYKDEPNNTRCQWQTYFVNKKYGFNTPPTVDPVKKIPGTAGMVSELLLEIRTGGDDLRGGNDNVSVTIRIKGKPDQKFANINKSARWIGNYTETVPLKLSSPVRKEDIQNILFSTTFGGGMGGDNWNMDWVKIMVNGGEILAEKSGTPLFRFTADRKFYTLVIQ